MAKPYDPKKSCWYPLKEGGFAEGVIEQAEGDKVIYIFQMNLNQTPFIWQCNCSFYFPIGDMTKRKDRKMSLWYPSCFIIGSFM